MCSSTDRAASLIEQVSDHITSRIEVFELHDHSVPEKELHDFLQLLYTHTKSVASLYRENPDLLPSAAVITRTIIEISSNIAGTINSSSHQIRENLKRLVKLTLLNTFGRLPAKLHRAIAASATGAGN